MLANQRAREKRFSLVKTKYIIIGDKNTETFWVLDFEVDSHHFLCRVESIKTIFHVHNAHNTASWPFGVYPCWHFAKALLLISLRTTVMLRKTWKEVLSKKIGDGLIECFERWTCNSWVQVLPWPLAAIVVQILGHSCKIANWFASYQLGFLTL